VPCVWSIYHSLGRVEIETYLPGCSDLFPMRQPPTQYFCPFLSVNLLDMFFELI
jgi:hypothetical protein